jgi:hypothetical protein
MPTQSRGHGTRLIRRKEEHFAEHLRAIFDFHLTFDANGPYLQVVSSLPNEA